MTYLLSTVSWFTITNQDLTLGFSMFPVQRQPASLNNFPAH